MLKYLRIIVLSVRRFFQIGYSQRATALTYYTLFAIVPIAALLFGIAKGFDMESILKREIAERFEQHADLVEWVCRFAETTLREASGGLIAGIGVAALFWTVIMLASNVEEAFNAVWQLSRRRSMFRKAGDYLATVLITPIVLIVIGSGSPLLKAFLNDLPGKLPFFHETGATVLALVGNLTSVVFACLLFTVIYLVVPNTKVRPSAALTGGIAAGILFQGLQSGFIFIQIALSKYNTIYGSFAILPLFLFWLQFSWMIALLGAEIAYVQQHIDKGHFNGEELSLSARFRRIARLAILRRAIRAYCNNETPPAARTIADELELSDAQTRQLLDELLTSGLLLAVLDASGSEIGLVPAIPPDKLTLAMAHARFDESGYTPAGAYVTGLADAAAAWNKLEKTIRESTDNILVRDL